MRHYSAIAPRASTSTKPATYDAALGRFISADTIVPDPNNPQALNRYAYALNNPMRYTDPTGNYSDGCYYCGGGVDSYNRFDFGLPDFNAQTSTFNLSVINTSTVSFSADFNRYPVQNFDFSRERSLSDPFFSYDGGGNLAFISSDTNGYYQSSSIFDNDQGLAFGIPQYDSRAQQPTIFDDGASLPSSVIDVLSPFMNRSALLNARLNNGIPNIIRDFRNPYAFTFGNDLYFAPSVYNPNTARGLAVIGHEVFHSQQMTDRGLFLFLDRYVGDYVVNRLFLGQSDQNAYLNIFFEVQATKIQVRIFQDLVQRGYPEQ